MSKASGKRSGVRPNQWLWNIGRRSISRTRRFKWIRKFPYKIVLGLIFLFLIFEISTLPILSIFNLDTDNPKQTALMQQRKEEARHKGKKLTIDYRWVSLTKIPQHVRKAVLIAEDARFYSHAGID